MQLLHKGNCVVPPLDPSSPECVSFLQLPQALLKCGKGPHFVLFIDKGCNDADGRVVCSIGYFCHCSVFLHIKIHNHRQHLTTELAELPVIKIIIIVWH